MIGSRVVGLLRHVTHPVNKKFLTNQQQIRLSSTGDWCYRTRTDPPKWASRGATATAVFLWWYFWWNMYHGWSHIVGLYDGEFLPDPREDFTDEELGIPPD